MARSQNHLEFITAKLGFELGEITDAVAKSRAANNSALTHTTAVYTVIHELNKPLTVDFLREIVGVLGLELDIMISDPNATPIPPRRLFQYPDLWDKPVGELGLSMRATNVLTSNDIRYLGQLIQLDTTDIRKFINCGRSTIANILSIVVGELGMAFKTDVGQWKPPVG